MSLRTWKKEFYSVPADRVSEENALKHSLKKWIGLLSTNREKHNVKLYNNCLCDIADIEDPYDNLDIDSDSCALCAHFIDNDCLECPLYKIDGDKRCDDPDGAYYLFMDRGAVRPMISLLERASQEQEKKNDKISN